MSVTPQKGVFHQPVSQFDHVPLEVLLAVARSNERDRPAMMRQFTITVVIPTKNEAGGIAEIVRAVKPYADEILVIDGHSTDGTADLARQAGARVVLDNGRGKGAGMKLGIAEARSDILVFMDADGSHDPACIPSLVAPLLGGQADLVVGSRHHGGSDEWRGDLDNFLRAMGGGIITIAINYRWNVRITDALNGQGVVPTPGGVLVGRA